MKHSERTELIAHIASRIFAAIALTESVAASVKDEAAIVYSVATAAHIVQASEQASRDHFDEELIP